MAWQVWNYMISWAATSSQSFHIGTAVQAGYLRHSVLQLGGKILFKSIQMDRLQAWWMRIPLLLHWAIGPCKENRRTYVQTCWSLFDISKSDVMINVFRSAIFPRHVWSTSAISHRQLSASPQSLKWSLARGSPLSATKCLWYPWKISVWPWPTDNTGLMHLKSKPLDRRGTLTHHTLRRNNAKSGTRDVENKSDWKECKAEDSDSILFVLVA